MELVFGLLILAFLIIGINIGMREAQAKKAQAPATKITVTVERQPAEPVVDKTVYNEAKETLKLCGFSVKEAKELLDKTGPYDDSETWVREAMKQVKI